MENLFFSEIFLFETNKIANEFFIIWYLFNLLFIVRMPQYYSVAVPLSDAAAFRFARFTDFCSMSSQFSANINFSVE